MASLRAMGLEFAHPIGVAAGLDRDGSRLAELAAAGFAFVEVGTVNATCGADATTLLPPIISNIAGPRPSSAPGPCGMVVGVSLGSRRDVLDAGAVADILAGARACAPHADFLVVNLSRPGSASRAEAAEAKALRVLLEQVRSEVDAASVARVRRVPLLVKVAMTPGAAPLPAAAELAVVQGYDGVVAAFEHWPSVDAVCRRLTVLRGELGALSLVAVGGVHTADTANRYLEAGAALVEVYSAIAAAGPGIAGALVPGGAACESP
ncbi:MAG: hypothetical protein IT493_01645 [Gammaproteobacteria bacterium]|nr:hypothetical protein [Gammaproteobacteria bacterium]